MRGLPELPTTGDAGALCRSLVPAVDEGNVLACTFMVRLAFADDPDAEAERIRGEIARFVEALRKAWELLCDVPGMRALLEHLAAAERQG